MREPFQLLFTFMFAEYGRMLTQKEVAQQLGISQSKVSRIEKEAFRKIREYPGSRDLMLQIIQHNSRPTGSAVENSVLHSAGAVPVDASYLAI